MLLTTPEVAERLKVSTKTITRLIQQGEIKAVTVVGWRGLRFDSDEVARFEADRLRPTDGKRAAG